MRTDEVQLDLVVQIRMTEQADRIRAFCRDTFIGPARSQRRSHCASGGPPPAG